jgi:hypothetical protein
MHLIYVYCDINLWALAYTDCSEPGTALPERSALPERYCFGE